jgi:hypothetical protein
VRVVRVKHESVANIGPTIIKPGGG